MAATAASNFQRDSGHLPVDCDKLQRFVGPVLNALGGEEKSVSLGRAIARVSAHEIYHMLTASEEHARRGISRASLSRADLMAPTFVFGQAQARWLRAWAASSSGRPDEVAAGLRLSPAQSGIEQAGADVSAGR